MFGLVQDLLRHIDCEIQAITIVAPCHALRNFFYFFSDHTKKPNCDKFVLKVFSYCASLLFLIFIFCIVVDGHFAKNPILTVSKAFLRYSFRVLC